MLNLVSTRVLLLPTTIGLGFVAAVSLPPPIAIGIMPSSKGSSVRTMGPCGGLPPVSASTSGELVSSDNALIIVRWERLRSAPLASIHSAWNSMDLNWASLGDAAAPAAKLLPDLANSHTVRVNVRLSTAASQAALVTLSVATVQLRVTATGAHVAA